MKIPSLNIKEIVTHTGQFIDDDSRAFSDHPLLSFDSIDYSSWSDRIGNN